MGISALWNFEKNDRPVLFWRLQLLGWTALNSVPVFLMLFILQFPISLVLLQAILRTATGIIATTYVLRPVLRRSRAKGLPISILLVLPAIVFVALTDGLLVRTLIHDTLSIERTDAMRLLTNDAVRMVVYFFWSLLYLLTDKLLRVQEEVLRLSHLKSELKSAELQLLRDQINPHFLFNALTAVESVAGDRERVIEITQGLSDYLRLAVRDDAVKRPLQDEIDALKSYLHVQKIRFGDAIEYEIQVSEEASQTVVPTALVQPLLENAIKHGSRSAERPLSIRIMANFEDRELCLSVHNSGKWREPNALDSGTGLVNLQRRLEFICGQNARLKVEKFRDAVQVEIRIAVDKPETQQLANA
jgi:sensor histidine kinase YesM